MNLVDNYYKLLTGIIFYTSSDIANFSPKQVWKSYETNTFQHLIGLESQVAIMLINHLLSSTKRSENT